MGTVLAVLAVGQLLAGVLVVLLAAPASSLLALGAVLAALATWPVAASTLRQIGRAHV